MGIFYGKQKFNFLEIFHRQEYMNLNLNAYMYVRLLMYDENASYPSISPKPYILWNRYSSYQDSYNMQIAKIIKIIENYENFFFQMTFHKEYTEKKNSMRFRLLLERT